MCGVVMKGTGSTTEGPFFVSNDGSDSDNLVII